VLLGVENPKQSTLENFKKGITPGDAKKAVKLLKENDISAHTMFIIGERKDTAESIGNLREFVNLDEYNEDEKILDKISIYKEMIDNIKCSNLIKERL
ncbi:MAG: hypothetical protein HXX81_08045, partial [Campylobacterales bacterium]|nr:hypothetical protein [Campylobacterales bacterium]